jgi:hypothetical protein
MVGGTPKSGHYHVWRWTTGSHMCDIKPTSCDSACSKSSPLSRARRASVPSACTTFTTFLPIQHAIRSHTRQPTEEDQMRNTCKESCTDDNLVLQDQVNIDIDLTIFVAQRKLQQILQKCTVFAELSEDDSTRIARAMEALDVSEGTKIIAQGDEGDCMYFLSFGSFKCYDEPTGKVYQVYQEEGDIASVSSHCSSISLEPRQSSLRKIQHFGNHTNTTFSCAYKIVPFTILLRSSS